MICTREAGAGVLRDGASVAAARGTRSAREVSKIKEKVKLASRRQTRVVDRVAGAVEAVRRVLRVIMPLRGEGEVAVVAERRCERSTIRDSLLVASASRNVLAPLERHTFQSLPANRSSTIHQHSPFDHFCCLHSQNTNPTASSRCINASHAVSRVLFLCASLRRAERRCVILRRRAGRSFSSDQRI